MVLLALVLQADADIRGCSSDSLAESPHGQGLYQLLLRHVCTLSNEFWYLFQGILLFSRSLWHTLGAVETSPVVVV